MKLYFYQDDMPNFGDDLNAWLWPKVIPELLDDDASHLLLGIGTIINHKLPKAHRYTVLGSGVGYGQLPQLNEHWRVLSVRGKSSCQALGLDESLGIIDPAYLLPEYLDMAAEPKRYPVSLIPHAQSLEMGHWQAVAAQLGIHLIDPRTNNIEAFVREVASSEQVITEAMHGAIVADCYGVPWVGYRAYPYINAEKWNDWLSVFGHQVTLTDVPSLHKGDQGYPFISKLKSRIKHVAHHVGMASSEWAAAIPRRTNSKQFDEICQRLSALMNAGEYYCSTAQQKQDCVGRLKQQIALLKTSDSVIHQSAN